MKYRSRAKGQGACLKDMPRTISMQSFTLAAITGAEKIEIWHKYLQSQWTVKYRSRALGQGACFKSMSKTITMQDLTLTAIIDAEKTKLLSNFNIKINKVNGPSNIGQWHWVKVHACRVCQGQFNYYYYARFHTHGNHWCRENQTST